MGSTPFAANLALITGLVSSVLSVIAILVGFLSWRFACEPTSSRLDALLRALGIPGEHVPPGTEERGRLWRSVLAQIGEPVLIIADNASSVARVRPLLPGSGPHRVMVTSRHTLAGLVPGCWM